MIYFPLGKLEANSREWMENCESIVSDSVEWDLQQWCEKKLTLGLNKKCRFLKKATKVNMFPQEEHTKKSWNSYYPHYVGSTYVRNAECRVEWYGWSSMFIMLVQVSLNLSMSTSWWNIFILIITLCMCSLLCVRCCLWLEQFHLDVFTNAGAVDY